jgi:ABC-type antimicrobial peptide transport system permease subunit
MRRFGGDSAVVGPAIRMHSVERGNAPTLVTIVGVTPADFWPIHWRESEVLRPLEHTASVQPTLGRLAVIEERLNSIVRAQITGPVNSAWGMLLVPALEQHSGPVKRVLFAVFGAALFMLLAACGSVAGALVSRMAARREELGVRLSLGGSRARIVRQLLTESAVLGTLSGILGIGIAFVLLRSGATLIQDQLGTTVPRGSGALVPTMRVLVQAGLASALCGIALGAIPAFTFLQLDRRSAAFAALGTVRSSVARRCAVR